MEKSNNGNFLPCQGLNKSYKYFPLKNINNKIYIKFEQNSKQNKIRNPGIDLGRILATISIIIQHILNHGKGLIKYGHYKEVNVLFNSLFFNVNTYIFISGYVGYKSIKYSNILYLWLSVLFYTISIIKYYSIYKPHLYNKKIEINDFFPVLTKKYWYFTVYFGMYLFLPIINKGIENINKSQMKLMLKILLVVYIVVKDYMFPKSDVFLMNNGYSVIWFLIFYLTGAYFGKFKDNSSLNKKTIYNIIYIIIFYFATFSCIKLLNIKISTNNQSYKDKFFIFLKYIFVPRINSLPMILQSISLILFLTNINYNKYIAKIFTFIGPLTFGIYLIHENIIIRRIIIWNILNNYPRNIPVKIVIKIIIIKTFIIFGLCAIIEYIRDILFKICQIRKICILIEKFIIKSLG